MAISYQFCFKVGHSEGSGNLEGTHIEWDTSAESRDSWTARVRFPAVQDFSLLHRVQAGSGAHSASYPMGTGGSFPGDKATGA
jgi:hypothetical protein